MNALIGWLFFLIPLIAFLAAGVLLDRRTWRLLYRWAETQGFDVIRITRPPFMRPGPFLLQNKRSWGIAQIVVRNTGRSERLGWVRYPVDILALQAGEFDRTQVVCDDEWDRNRPLF